MGAAQTEYKRIRERVYLYDVYHIHEMKFLLKIHPIASCSRDIFDRVILIMNCNDIIVYPSRAVDIVVLFRKEKHTV